MADATGEDEALMREAMAAAAAVRGTTSPNPWVGCVIVPEGDGPAAIGATEPPGGPHAEAAALALAGDVAKGSTVYVTLEPCCHQGRTPPCADALIDAGVGRVVIGVEDPDPRVRGQGIARLRDAGVDVEVGVCRNEIVDQLAPYLKHRATGRPWVILKLATTMDGHTAAPDGSSQWITGPLARTDVHRLRAESDAVLVGAGTVRVDNPALTVRHLQGIEGGEPVEGGEGIEGGEPVEGIEGGEPVERGEPVEVVEDRQPLRVVLGSAPADARVRPALELSGDLEGVLEELGRRGVVQLLVEGGPTVAHEFHRAGLVDRYLLYLAPALFGGDDAKPLFAGSAAATIKDVWRGRIVSVEQLGPDLRIEIAPACEGEESDVYRDR